MNTLQTNSRECGIQYRKFRGIESWLDYFQSWIGSVTVVKLVALLFGTLIVYLAYKGYRRNTSKPLLYVALGFALITAATIVEGILYVIIGSDLLVALFIGTIITVIGFVVIIYSIHSVK